ncbi:MAG: nucleoside triphosphate pyrophosphohydrolase [bacterium]
MPKKKNKFDELVRIVRRLRAPNGCPWDRIQTHATLKPYMVEEVYEALEAIDSKDHRKLAEELGDILLHIVMHAEMSREEGKFEIGDVIDSISAKMVRRHPHVFSNKKVRSVEEVWKKWEEIKGEEVKGKGEKHKGILESVPHALPALYRADKVQRRAARVGFDWNNVAGAWRKVDEEKREIHELLRKSKLQTSKSKTNPKTKAPNKKQKERITEEIGDLLFAIVNVTRKLDIDGEEALQKATSKFMRRFKEIELHARRSGRHVSKLTLPEMDAVWNDIKRREKR